MADLAAISQLLTSINAVRQIASAAIDIRDSTKALTTVAELNDKIIDAQNSIFAIQHDRASLIQEIASLKQQLSELRAWDSEKERYELKPVPHHERVFAYSLKAERQGAEPAHWICPACYQRGKKSILQSETRFPGRAEVWVCHECKADIYVSGGRQM